MNRIEEGQIYTAIRQRSGETEKGKWELLLTEDDRGFNPIALFTENQPSGVKEGGKFRIEKIISASYGSKRSADGTWNPAVTITARVAPVESFDEFLEQQAKEELLKAQEAEESPSSEPESSKKAS